jgi:Putative Flp pilus-assembly TadE/G-like
MSVPILVFHAARRFAAHRGGNAAAAFGLALIPVAAAAGAAVDYTRAADTRAKLQAIVDAAVLNGLRAPARQRVSIAEAHTRSAVKGAGLALDQLSFAPTANQGLRGRVMVRLPSLFGNLLGTDGIDIAAGSEGFLKAGPASAGTVCLMLMDPSAAETLRVNGGAAVKAPKCEVHVHTTANVGALFNGNSSFDVKRICLKGPGYVANGKPKLGTVETACRTAGDPFAGQLAAPANLACTHTDKSFDASKGRKTELEPGVYCGNTTFNGNQDIVLKPGLYVLKNGAFTVNGGSSLTGAGVTIFLADAGSSLQLNGNSAVRLSAPVGGTHDGVVMFEPGGLSRSSLSFNGGSGHELKGLVYLPSRNVIFNGASTVHGDALTMVLNSLTVNGGGGTEWKLEPGPRAIAAPAATSATAEIILRY